VFWFYEIKNEALLGFQFWEACALLDFWEIGETSENIVLSVFMRNGNKKPSKLML
jgi:hypothetical protein